MNLKRVTKKKMEMVRCKGNSPVQMGGDNEMDGMKSIGVGEETDEEPEGDEVLTQQNGMLVMTPTRKNKRKPNLQSLKIENL